MLFGFFSGFKCPRRITDVIESCVTRLAAAQALDGAFLGRRLMGVARLALLILLVPRLCLDEALKVEPQRLIL